MKNGAFLFKYADFEIGRFAKVSRLERIHYAA